MAKMGRPSKYKKEFCDMLISHMSDGKSIESFAYRVNVCRDTISEWCKVHKDFSAAKKRGECASYTFWEHEGIRNRENKNYAWTYWIYSMKCRFGKWGWNPDKDIAKDVAQKVSEKLIIDLSGKMSDESKK